ncbi:sensor histidine kinase [Anaeromyxobacter sp. Red801]|uniref:sensor histidine kinase n=1 Tax=Anaeromyxobacter sp. Red801 TaxID=3411632 RepID=UPI003B9E4EAD
MRRRLRLLLLLQVTALAAASAALLLALGLPLLARGVLTPRAFALLALADAALVALLGAAILLRWVGAPVERLLAAASRIQAGEGELPPLGPPGEVAGAGLGRAALAFERTSAALGEERHRLAARVEELAAANARLAEAREELLRAERLATVGRLAAGIAHEVGNPLGAITGYAELARARLEGGGAPAEVADFLARISAETQRIDAIVRDLLDFARPSRLDLAPVGLPAAIDAALRLARMQERFRGVRIELELPAQLPPVVADERRLAQVFLNLLLNAADAMEGAGAVRIRARAVDAAVEVEVADEGPGIPSADLPRVFDPFFTTKPPGRGTGLGLAVCHGIMESFGGGIAAERSARGALLRLRLRTPRLP